MISRANISKELTPNLGSAKRRNKMAKMDRVGLYPAEEKRSGTASQAARRRNMKKGGKAKAKANVDDFSGLTVADVERAARESFKEHQRVRKNRAKNKRDPLGRKIDDMLRSMVPGSLPTSTQMEPKYADLWGRSTADKVKILKNRKKKKVAKKKSGGTAKLAAGGQGYSAREDESLGMRTGPERTKSQSMAARRDESYGDWGKRKRGRVNVKKGGSIKKMSSGGIALRGHGAEVR